MNQDPWSGSAFPALPAPATQTSTSSQPDPWAHYNQGAAYFGGAEDSGTDTETASSNYTTVVDGPDLQGMTEAQVGEHLFWNYCQNKSRWRAWAGTPVRRARRFMRRKGKGIGKHKGAFLASLSDDEVSNIFYTGGEGQARPQGETCLWKVFWPEEEPEGT